MKQDMILNVQANAVREISHKYAEAVSDGTVEILQFLAKDLKKIINRIKLSEMLAANGDDDDEYFDTLFDDILEKYEIGISKYYDFLDDKYHEDIKKMIELCTAYAKDMGYSVKINPPGLGDLIPESFMDVDAEELLSRTELGMIMTMVEDIVLYPDDPVNILRYAGAIVAIPRIKGIIKRTLNSCIKQMAKKVPDKKVMERVFYQRLTASIRIEAAIDTEASRALLK